MSTTAERKPNKNTEKVALPVSGMSCAGCAARIEKNLNRAQGVEDANVNFANQTATVTFNPTQTNKEALCEVVRDTGYDVREAPSKGSGELNQDWEQKAREEEIRDIQRRLVVALLFGAPVALLGMAHISFPGSDWIQLALTAPVLFYAGGSFFQGGWNALKHRAADMNTLVALGTGTAFLFSVVATVAPHLVAADAAHGQTVPVYFEAAASIIALLLVGRLL
jgi:Cu+-exporting ATPase